MPKRASSAHGCRASNASSARSRARLALMRGSRQTTPCKNQRIQRDFATCLVLLRWETWTQRGCRSTRPSGRLVMSHGNKRTTRCRCCRESQTVKTICRRFELVMLESWTASPLKSPSSNLRGGAFLFSGFCKHSIGRTA